MDKTTQLELPFPTDSDANDVAGHMQGLAEKVESTFLNLDPAWLTQGDPDAGELIIVNGTGAAAFQAMTGAFSVSGSGVATLNSDVVDRDHIGPDLQHFRSGSSTLAHTAAQEVNLIWPVAFADLNYTIQATPIFTSVLGTLSNVGQGLVYYVAKKEKSKAVFYIYNGTGANFTFSVDAIAIHD